MNDVLEIVQPYADEWDRDTAEEVLHKPWRTGMRRGREIYPVERTFTPARPPVVARHRPKCYT